MEAAARNLFLCKRLLQTAGQESRSRLWFLGRSRWNRFMFAFVVYNVYLCTIRSLLLPPTADEH